MESNKIVYNIGPSHPAMHGTIRLVTTLEGEHIIDIDTQIGYLHRGFEKTCENRTYTQCIPYTDRLNYVSPLINNVAFAMAVEKLIGLDVPPRCKYIRVLVSEISRITDHLTCIAASAMELGAFTVFFYLIRAREHLWWLIEELTGARLTTNYTRIGGLRYDLPDGFLKHVEKELTVVEEAIVDTDRLLTKNRIFYDRMRGVGVISKEDAIAFGFTGPCLRSTGVDYDVRKAKPYLIYKELDFEIPVGDRGDNFDRYLVRMEEIRQSIKIIRQVIEKIPEGRINVDDPRYVLPDKSQVYGSIEGKINHFKLIMEGIHVPEGEIYCYVEGANGELGFYIVSDGSGRPYRCRVRPPCFYLMQGLSTMLKDQTVADIIPTFGSINMIGGECDR